MINRYYIC